MVKFSRHVLDNGLRVMINQDQTSQMVAVNILYDVGAKDENPEQTGLAHLFEHLMFGGSANVKNYDNELQKVGGENNAYTTNDFTNYHIQVLKKNLETALWLESDRMLKLSFSQQRLDVQKKVVCEEFKEHYLNKPYGDAWKIIRQMCYKVHPYMWMTIGKDLVHIENVDLDDVKLFFKKHYNPSNAILSISGNIEEEEEHALSLVKKWFEEIPSGSKYVRSLKREPEQNKARFTETENNVHSNAFYKCWKVCNRLDDNYYTLDIISDILGQGNSSRLHIKFIKELKLFSKISSYHLGSIDNGLFVIEGKLNNNVTYEQVEEELEKELEKIKTENIQDEELEKIKNQIETFFQFEQISILNRANKLAFYDLLGDCNLINTEFKKYTKISSDNIRSYANQIFRKENSNTLYYKAK